jgi:hypothetical protein
LSKRKPNWLGSYITPNWNLENKNKNKNYKIHQHTHIQTTSYPNIAQPHGIGNFKTNTQKQSTKTENTTSIPSIVFQNTQQDAPNFHKA